MGELRTRNGSLTGAHRGEWPPSEDFKVFHCDLRIAPSGHSAELVRTSLGARSGLCTMVTLVGTEPGDGEARTTYQGAVASPLSLLTSPRVTT